MKVRKILYVIFYSTKLSRWPSRDPIGEIAFHVQEFSIAQDVIDAITFIMQERPALYIFCNNQGVNIIDPKGLTGYIFPGIPDNWKPSIPSPEDMAGCICEAGSQTGKRQNRNYKIEKNDCTGVGPGPFNFTEACNNHDVCYGTCLAGRGSCDEKFLADMRNICSERCGADKNCLFNCDVLARTYYRGVRFGGGLYYDGDGKACEDCCCPWIQ